MSKRVQNRSAVAEVDIALLAFLYAGQAAVALLLLCAHKKGDQSLLTFIATSPGLLFVIASVVLVVAAALIGWRFYVSRQQSVHSFALTLAMNLLSVGAILAAGEMTIRTLSPRVLDGSAILNDELLLLPRRWGTVSENYLSAREQYDREYVFEYDAQVGWSLRPNLSDEYTMYTTSAEGIRSGSPDMIYRNRSPRKRIALVGDSFAYSEDVPFADSWGYRLEKKLGSDVQVLNFAVPAYGVDQAYLKYEHTVKSWRPNIVLFGIFPADLARAMVVYPFIRRPQWENPYSKPRLISLERGITAINIPTIVPADIFSRLSIADLPHLAYDRAYRTSDWNYRWYHSPFLIRFFISRFPRWEEPHRVDSDREMETLALNIFREFISSATEAGSQPLLVYLPGRGEVADFSAGRANPRVAKRILANAQLPHIDLTKCVAQIPHEERFMFDGAGHYTPRSNEAIAVCISKEISN